MIILPFSTGHTGPEWGHKMKKSDAQVSQRHFLHVIPPEKTQKTVKKVSEPVFSNVEFFFYHFRVPGKEELSNFSTYESYLNVKR